MPLAWLTTQQKTGIRFALVVERSEYKIIGKNSPYEFPVSILLIAGLLVDHLSDSTGNHLSYAD